MDERQKGAERYVAELWHFSEKRIPYRDAE
jgi:hypothetical protein